MTEISKCKFEAGRLYLFTVDQKQYRTDADALYGVYDSHNGNRIILETCSRDMLNFHYYTPLPQRFGYAREADASEYRDFFFNAGWDAAFIEINRKKSYRKRK